jgi:hypothetical protein
VCDVQLGVEAFVTLAALQNWTALAAAATAAGLPVSPPPAGDLASVVHRACYCSDIQLYTGVASLLVLVVAYYYFVTHVSAKMDEVDAGNQTAADFTVCVEDPDPDARDPDEWRDYFSKYGAVAAVTVVLDNVDLLERLARRRFLMTRIMSQGGDTRQSLPSVTTGWKRGLLAKLGLGKDKYHWIEQYNKNELEVLAFLGHEYFATKVYVTFDDEAARCACCNRLMQGAIPAQMNLAMDLPKEEWFRQANVLSLTEAPEPEAIHFNNVSASTRSNSRC